MLREFHRQLHFTPRWTLLPLRLVVGIGFIAHGVAKWTHGPVKFGLLLQQAGVPFPVHMAWLVLLFEVFGVAALVAGVLVTFVSIPLAISMVVAILTVQIHYGFSPVKTIGLTASGPVFWTAGIRDQSPFISRACSPWRYRNPLPFLSIACSTEQEDCEEQTARVEGSKFVLNVRQLLFLRC